MPLEYDIIEDKQLVMLKGSGVVTGNEVIKHLDSLAADIRYKAPMKKLVDYRSIDSISIFPEDAKKIVQKKQSHIDVFHGEKCAFVSPGDLTYGVSRVHQVLIEMVDVDTEVFREMKDALDWLDVTSDANLEKMLEEAMR